MRPTPEDSPTPELAELLAQAGWMGALARSLVASPEEAEEVLQDAWVVALRKRSSVRTDLASWLRAVLRNLALGRAGRESRRATIERQAARPACGAPPGEVRDAVERMELQRWMAEALLRLDEPYRSAVILRHLEGLDPGEIARRQGCSREAARQRIARGLARLRTELDTKHGGREAWCLLLAPWVGRELAPLSVPLTAGGVLMGSKAVLASLAAVAALVLAWLAFQREPTPQGQAGDGLAPAEAPAGALAADPGSGPARPAPAARREALPAASPVPAAAPATAASDPLLGRLTGRVLDPDHAPLAGAEVVVHRPQAGQLTMLDLETRHAPHEVARARTDADGRFAFALERGIPFDLRASADGFCAGRRPECYAGEALELTLSAGFLVHGTVRRERDGGPVADARVRVFQLSHTNSDEGATRSEADGSYRLRIPFQEDATLEVTPLREQGSGWIPLTFDADGTVRQDLLLGDGIEVRGKVLEAGSGKPIAGARVGEGWTYRRSATTDERGEYVLPGFGITGVQELFAKAEGYGQTQLATLPPARDGVLHVDFELPRGRVARGRVIDPEGRPLADAYVAAVASETGREGQRSEWLSGRTDFAGRFELGGLTPGLPHALLACAAGFATLVYDFPASEAEQAELDLGDVRLARPSMLAGRVEDETGRPLAGLEVLLSGANADRGRLRRVELAPAGGWYVEHRSATTDAEGRFWFGALPAGTFSLGARSPGRPPSPRLPVELAEGELRENVVLAYPRGESIRGTIVDEQGHGLAGVYVNASLERARDGAKGELAELRTRATATARTNAEGLFVLEGLLPGTHHLDLHPFELEGDPEAPWLSSETRAESVPPGAAAEPLRLVLARGRSIRGRLVDGTGAPLVGYIVVGTCESSLLSPSATSAEDGAFTLEVPAGTVWDLEVRGAWQTEAWETVYHTERGIAAGAREVQVRAEIPVASGDAGPR